MSPESAIISRREWKQNWLPEQTSEYHLNLPKSQNAQVPSIFWDSILAKPSHFSFCNKYKHFSGSVNYELKKCRILNPFHWDPCDFFNFYFDRKLDAKVFVQCLRLDLIFPANCELFENASRDLIHRQQQACVFLHNIYRWFFGSKRDM